MAHCGHTSDRTPIVVEASVSRKDEGKYLITYIGQVSCVEFNMSTHTNEELGMNGHLLEKSSS